MEIVRVRSNAAAADRERVARQRGLQLPGERLGGPRGECVVGAGQQDDDLGQTVEAFLDADGNVAGTAQRLFTHRHTIRYRLERVRELTGLDVGSTDGREKLSLGLKAMRDAEHAHRDGPAREAGAEAGRVPRRS